MYPFKKKQEYRNRTAAVATYYYTDEYGPLIGGGADIVIHNKCNTNKYNECKNTGGSSFDFDPQELSGCKEDGGGYSTRCVFTVIDYEVFAIDIS